MDYKKFLEALNFIPKENAFEVFIKKYPLAEGYAIEVNFEKQTISYGDKIKSESKTTQNFSQPENFVVLECVNRLLEKGYQPENIVLEKTWSSGHGTSGQLDICVNRNDGSEYMLIECKTHGKEFDKEFSRMKKDGGQLFTYFKFSNKADMLVLYSSDLKGNYRNEIVKIESDHRSGDVKDFYEKWNKLTKDNGVFDPWVKPYNFESKALTPKQLKPIQQEDSSLIFNQFLEILRHNVVSDKPNAFNKIFTLFLCKVYDEKTAKPNEELKFQWLEGKDDDITFQIRLTDLYKAGMKEFLEKDVTDFSEDDFDTEYKNLDESIKKSLLHKINKIRLEKNNEFAIKEVFDEKSFKENAKIVKEVVELLQNYRLRYNKRQQYLSDFFELLLTTGLKQETGQFFTPVPIAQFIIKSLPIDKFVNEKLEKGTANELLPYIIDYAAGSGHFVTESMHEIQHFINEKKTENYIESTANEIKKWQIDHFDWATKYVYGIEKDYRLVKVGKVGCYLHGDGLANVILSDGLANFKHSEYKLKLQNHDSIFSKENKQFDIVVSNPPYSVAAFKNTAKEYYSDKDFDLYDYLTDKSSEIECLFVERTKQLLKDRGVAGVILPSSILSNEGIYTKAREIILQYFEIIAITELGSNTFMATGTNTMVLFLKRRNNYDSINLRKSIARFFDDWRDVTLNGTEKPVAKYVNHVWENISFNDYITLLKKEPNDIIINHELYKEYRKKIKPEKDFWNTLVETEKEKLLYFILSYPQKIVLVKTGEKDTEKRFLGYEFSNRRGNEGIHPIQRGKTIDECTRLFDDEIFDNPEKASTYIYKAFNGDYDFPIHETLKDNISRVRLVDMLIFDRTSFTKNISTSVKKKVKIESKWEQILLINTIQDVAGSTKKIEKYNIKEIGKFPVITQEKEKIIAGYSDDNNPVTDVPIILFGDHSCSLKYIDFNFFQGADGTVLLKPKENFNSKYFYYVLRYLLLDLIENRDKYERHYKYLKNLYIPLPPKEIQEKIVAEIEVLEKEEIKTIKKKEILIAKINEIIKTKFLQEYKLGKIISLEYGIALPDKNRIKGDYPVVGSNGIVGWHNDFLVEAPAIVIGRKGSAGRINWINKNCTPIDTTLFVQRLECVNYSLKILYYAIKKMDLENLASGAGVPGLNRNDAYAKNINLPPIPEQQKIVSEIEKIEVQIANFEEQLSEFSKQKEDVLKKYL